MAGDAERREEEPSLGQGLGWGLRRAHWVRDSRAGEGCADETQHPASSARQSSLLPVMSPGIRDSVSYHEPLRAELLLSQGTGQKEEMD